MLLTLMEERFSQVSLYCSTDRYYPRSALVSKDEGSPMVAGGIDGVGYRLNHRSFSEYTVVDYYVWTGLFYSVTSSAFGSLGNTAHLHAGRILSWSCVSVVHSGQRVRNSEHLLCVDCETP